MCIEFSKIYLKALKNANKLEYDFSSNARRIKREYNKIIELGIQDLFVDAVQLFQKGELTCEENYCNSAILFLLGVFPKPLGEFTPFINVNSDRLAPIDIDIDVSGERRKEVIDYLHSQMQVAPIMAFNSLDKKSAIKDLGKAYNFPYSMMDAITKSLDEQTPSKFVDALIYKYPNFWEDAQNLEGVIRHCSIHASGLAIFEGTPESNFIALRKAPRTHEVVVDMDGQTLESLGVIKVDILGSLTTDIIQNAAPEGLPPLNEIIYNQEVLDMFKNCDVSGIFQAGGNTNKRVFQIVKPETFQEVVDCISLGRPGTKAQLDAYQSYTPNINNERINELLKDTRGVLLYQEQVLLIAREIGKLTGPEAELLRRGIGKKKDEKFIEPIKNKFIENATEEVGEETAVLLWETMGKHMEYSFNKCHAVAYAAQSFKQMYLKRFYPAHFWASTFRYCKDEEKPEYRYEMIKDGIELLGPSCKNYVSEHSVVDGNKVQLSPSCIKGIDKLPKINIQKLHKANNIFEALQCLNDYTNKQQLLLCKAGFFDAIDNNKENVANIIKGKGQISLFEDAPTSKTRWEMYEEEIELFGFWVKHHPLKGIDFNTTIIDTVLYGGDEVVGIVSDMVIKNDKNSKKMAFFTISDSTYYIKCFMFSNVLSNMEFMPVDGELVIASGRTNGGSFLVNSIERCSVGI